MFFGDCPQLRQNLCLLVVIAMSRVVLAFFCFFLSFLRCISCENTEVAIHTPGKGQASSDVRGSWPQFRGKDFNNIASHNGVSLATEWPPTGPKVLWEREVASGHAGPAVHKGVVYLVDYDPNIFPDPDDTSKFIGGDVIRAMSLADGRDIWTYAYPVKTVNNHGITRTVP